MHRVERLALRPLSNQLHSIQSWALMSLQSDSCAFLPHPLLLGITD